MSGGSPAWQALTHHVDRGCTPPRARSACSRRLEADCAMLCEPVAKRGRETTAGILMEGSPGAVRSASCLPSQRLTSSTSRRIGNAAQLRPLEGRVDLTKEHGSSPGPNELAEATVRSRGASRGQGVKGSRCQGVKGSSRQRTSGSSGRSRASRCQGVKVSRCQAVDGPTARGPWELEEVEAASDDQEDGLQ